MKRLVCFRSKLWLAYIGAMFCVLGWSCSPPASTEQPKDRIHVTLDRLGVTHIRADTDILVVIEDLQPPRYRYSSGRIAPVFGVSFHTEGVNLIISNADTYRQIPLVSSGELEIWQTRLFHTEGTVRVILNIGYMEAP